MRIVQVISLVLCLVFTGSWNRTAGQTATGEHLSIGQAVQEAIDKNLGLLAERYNISIADARIIAARLRPNPVFSLEAGHLLNLSKAVLLASLGATDLVMAAAIAMFVTM